VCRVSSDRYVCVLGVNTWRGYVRGSRRGLRSMKYIIRYVVYFGVIIRRSGCAACSARELPSPVAIVSNLCGKYDRVGLTYHLEGIQLLLDLLCQNGRQAIAGSNVTSAIILRAAPGVVELNTRREGD